MGESGSGGGIRKIVGGHIDGLYRSDRALLRRRDTLLHGTHVSSEGRLVTYGRWDTTQQGGYLKHKDTNYSLSYPKTKKKNI